MGMFNSFEKKNIVPKAEENTIQNSDSNIFSDLAVENHKPMKPWVDRYYMSGFDVGEVKGYTDLIEKPRCDEEGTAALLKWARYGDFIIITGITDKNAQSVEIPQTINDAYFRKPTVIIMGAEDTGISKEVLKLCDEQLAIPLIGAIESLNVSAAAAVMLFEVVRQRIG